MVDIFGIELDDDIIQSPAYWLITGGAILALIIGFGGGGIMKGLGVGGDVTYEIPLLIKGVIICCIPLLAYGVVKFVQR